MNKMLLIIAMSGLALVSFTACRGSGGQITKSEDSSQDNKFEGTWYSQDDSNAILTIKNDGMTYKEADIDSSASFEPEAKENYVSLSVTSELFFLYEINYHPDEDRIEAYTQPELDGDGGYKRMEFRRTAYGPGDKAMLEYLYGAWEIMDDGELMQEPGIRRDILYFPLPQYKTVRFVRANGDKKTFNIELTDVFDDTVKTGTYDRLTMSAKFSSGEYTWDEVRPGQSFQILIANNLGMDYLMLRELGDERTGFATDGLQYERSMSGIWFFKRPDSDTYDGEYDTEGTTPSTVGNEEQVRLKDTSFYAIKWLEFGNSCTLQRVEVQETKAALGSSSEDALGYYLPDDEYAYSAVNYEYSGMENMAHGGYFDPALVQVVTDESGQIVEMSKYEYAWDGMYYEHSEKIFQK
ncbi:hypothetical protein [Butyrivibrio sp. INlla16]|uniref:hypothetical protein n=1 Tax=Butyrivibrio sp. INlla16 TaxID=1520807 RepID=UPI000883139F|nr:hypothetical protein [Butyrivibrio sp. INlla16]SDB42871.1 hypothetical protein SAMN02910263_02081 [Butyrivibrio sp. INlla16]